VTHFLPAGFLKEELREIERQARLLQEELRGAGAATSARLRALADDIARRAREAYRSISRLSCEPLIWTGAGSTDEVISMLERLLVDGSPTGAVDTREG